jgi:hypothetical protein
MRHPCRLDRHEAHTGPDSSAPPPQTINIHCRNRECGELCYPGDEYCSSFCREVGLSGGTLLPSGQARGLQGARTERPTGEDPPAPDPFLSTPIPPGADTPIPYSLASNPPLEGEAGFPVLPTDSEARKSVPIFSGVLNYFPLAIAAVARLSKRGNDKHNPGEPLHWARDKSQDHEDCIARHLIDVDTIDTKTGEYEDAVALAWRALAKLQCLEEKRLGRPYSRGSR